MSKERSNREVLRAVEASLGRLSNIPDAPEIRVMTNTLGQYTKSGNLRIHQDNIPAISSLSLQAQKPKKELDLHLASFQTPVMIPLLKVNPDKIFSYNPAAIDADILRTLILTNEFINGGFVNRLSDVYTGAIKRQKEYLELYEFGPTVLDPRIQPREEIILKLLGPDSCLADFSFRDWQVNLNEYLQDGYFNIPPISRQQLLEDQRPFMFIRSQHPDKISNIVNEKTEGRYTEMDSDTLAQWSASAAIELFLNTHTHEGRDTSFNYVNNFN